MVDSIQTLSDVSPGLQAPFLDLMSKYPALYEALKRWMMSKDQCQTDEIQAIIKRDMNPADAASLMSATMAILEEMQLRTILMRFSDEQLWRISEALRASK